MSKEFGITASKEKNFSEWYTQVVLKAELADYAPVKGLIIVRPNGYSIWESIKKSLNEKLEKTDHQNAFLPTLIPESLLTKEKKHFEGFNPEVFWVTHSGDDEIGDKLALRPTSETLAYSIFSKWIKSWRDLPLKLNFWNTALRAEIKATKPFLRTSEFLWQEGHTVHATKEEAETEVSEILSMYKQTVEEELAIPVVVGKKSEKEKFVGAVYTTTMEALMPDGKALQMGTSHFLGQNFSIPFEIKFSDLNNQEKNTWQTSWGVSWRLLGGMIMVHGDDKGLVLPPRVAPIQVIIIPIYYSEQDSEKILQLASQIEIKLQEKGIRIKIDRRDELTPGYKFHDWELKGIPLRIEIGPKDLKENKAVIAKRNSGEKLPTPLEELEKTVENNLAEIQKELFDAANEFLNQNIMHAKNFDDFKKQIENSKMISASWCGFEECENNIKEQTGADIRVIPFESTSEIKTCIYCQKEGKFNPLFARGY